MAYVYLPSVAPATPPTAEKHAAEETHEEHEEESAAEDHGEHEKHGVAEGLASHAGSTKSHGSMQEVDLGEFQ